MPAPTPEAQLVFLTKLQRLFAEGDFTATYKYALLMVLAELAVAGGRDDGAEMTLRMQDIAAGFVRLYWQQACPYSSATPGTQPKVLMQNAGKQAAVITAILKFRNQHPSATIQSAVRCDTYASLLREVARTVSDQPVRYLQNIGGHSDSFLFETPRDLMHNFVLAHPGCNRSKSDTLAARTLLRAH